MKTIQFIACLSLFFLFTISPSNVIAQTCEKVIKSRTGTVYAGGPARTTFTPNESVVTIEIRKKSGRAQTTVNFYIDGQLQLNKTLTFQNGNYTDTQSSTLRNVRGREVRVDIVNQSVANKFEYSLKARVQTLWLGSGKGNIYGQDKKTFTLSVACQNDARITIQRTGGKAKAIINVYTLSGRSLNNGGTVMNRNQSSIRIPISGIRNQRIRVEVKNVSVANWLKFSMDARNIN